MPTGHLPTRMRGSSVIDLVQEGELIMQQADALDLSSYDKWRTHKYGGAVTDGMRSMAKRMRGSLRFAIAEAKLGFGDSSSGHRVFYDFGSPMTNRTMATSLVRNLQGSSTAATGTSGSGSTGNTDLNPTNTGLTSETRRNPAMDNIQQAI